MNTKKLLEYSNYLIDCDINNFFNYSSMVSSLKNIPRVFGQNISKAFDFIKKWYNLEFNKGLKDNFNNTLVLGGDLTLEKLQFLLFS